MASSGEELAGQLVFLLPHARSFKDSLGQKLFTADANGDGALTRARLRDGESCRGAGFLLLRGAEFQTGLATVPALRSEMRAL